MRLRRPHHLVFAFTAAILLAVAALQLADLWWERDRDLRTAEARALNLSVVLGAYVREKLTAADTALAQLEVHGRRIGGPAAADRDWLPILQAALAALPDAGSISITDARGVIRHSTLPGIIGQSRADRPAFRQLRAIPAGMRPGVLIDVPLASPLHPGRFVLPVARRLDTPAGQFDGLAVVVVLPDAFREFLRTVQIGSEGAIWVFHEAGVVLFREPTTADPLGEQARAHPILQAALTHGAGVLRGPDEGSGLAVVTAYQKVHGLPLIIAVSLGEREALAGWREQRQMAAIEFAGFTVTLLALGLLLARQMTERANVERALADVQRLEADRLREVNEQLAGALEREQAARQDSEAASRLKDEFLMTLSHELRTPLNAILGWVRMLGANAVPEDQRARALATIERNAAAQTRLVEELLDVSRAITGKLRLQPGWVDIGACVAAAAETLRPAMAARQIAFRVDVQEGLPPTWADADRLQQVVWNLLSNAIKFTDPGGSVQLQAARVGDNIELVVRDTGAGIPADFLPYVFDRFRQADQGPRREHGGLGLGLAIARHLVELHGGTIQATSEGKGKGATFGVVLPMRRPEAGPQPAAAAIS